MLITNAAVFLDSLLQNQIYHRLRFLDLQDTIALQFIILRLFLYQLLVWHLDFFFYY
ncbi:unnamed protein product [Paramecium sonneborni]|uniref:Uncharacterized protein n=1 Tax=Paramecium sonneborni TaxID=65129 RepID=A0A8S1MTZ2_9CILI|nr:unnamed protein product [Paramecium sonneborni]